MLYLPYPNNHLTPRLSKAKVRCFLKFRTPHLPIHLNLIVEETSNAANPNVAEQPR